MTPSSGSRTLRRAGRALVALLAVAAWLGPAAVARAGAELVPGSPQQALVDETGVSRVDSEPTAGSTYEDAVAKAGGVQPTETETPVAAPEETVTNPPVTPEPTGGQTVTIDVVKPVAEAAKDTAPPAPTNVVAAARAAAVSEVKLTPPPSPDKPAPAPTSRRAPRVDVGSTQRSIVQTNGNGGRRVMSAAVTHAELESRAQQPTATDDSSPAPTLPSLPERSPDTPGAPLGAGAAFGALNGGAAGGLVVAIMLSLFFFTAPAGLRKVRLPDVVLVAPLLARACARPG